MSSTAILMYHSIDERGSLLSISPDVFRWQMRWLHTNGYDVLPFGEVVVRLKQGRDLPARSVCLTFDDGFEGVYRHAFPVLNQFGFPATVFLVLAFCGGQNNWPGQPPGIPSLPLASWDQICEMDAQGIEFGSHTISHPRLDQLAPAELEQEIYGSKGLIEERLGHPVHWFSAPYGRYNRSVQAVVRRVYQGACTTRLEWVQRSSDPYALGRIDSYYLRKPFFFRGLSGRFLPAYIYMRRNLKKAASQVLKRTWN